MTEIFNKSTVKKLRQNLRNKSVVSERLLWQKIRKKQIDYKFRRQVSVDKYIVDFYCPQLKLVIEVDGAHHETEEEVAKDKERQFYLESLGLIVKRYLNKDIKENLSGVLVDLSDLCKKLSSKSTPPCPSPS
jgi:very-short-patch-repair endonuclease